MTPEHVLRKYKRIRAMNLARIALWAFVHLPQIFIIFVPLYFACLVVAATKRVVYFFGGLLEAGIDPLNKTIYWRCPKADPEYYNTNGMPRDRARKVIRLALKKEKNDD